MPYHLYVNVGRVINTIVDIIVIKKCQKNAKNANEGWDMNELLQEKMTRLVFHSIMDVGNNEREMGKTIRAISKNVYLDNDTKSKYL